MNSYNPLSPVLLAMQHKARCVGHLFNTLDPSSGTRDEVADKRFELLTQMLGHIGKDTFIEPPLKLDYGINVSFGEKCFVNFG